MSYLEGSVPIPPLFSALSDGTDRKPDLTLIKDLCLRQQDTMTKATYKSFHQKLAYSFGGRVHDHHGEAHGS